MQLLARTALVATELCRRIHLRQTQVNRKKRLSKIYFINDIFVTTNSVEDLDKLVCCLCRDATVEGVSLSVHLESTPKPCILN
jgi:hypothetical protein